MNIVLFLLLCMFTTPLLHTLETSSSHRKPKAQCELTDAEHKRFGDNCYKLPYPLWINTLDFLLGERNE